MHVSVYLNVFGQLCVPRCLPRGELICATAITFHNRQAELEVRGDLYYSAQ